MDQPIQQSTTLLSSEEEKEFSSNQSAYQHHQHHHHQQQQTIQQKRTTSSSLWQIYCTFVRQNHVSLELLDAALSRILFWTPTATSDQAHRNREVLYGILSLHRLAMDTALQQQQEDQENNNFHNHQDYSYGTTIRPNPEEGMTAAAENIDGISTTAASSSSSQQQQTKQFLSPTRIRIVITVIQSLLPSILEIARSSVSANNNHDINNDNALQQEGRKHHQRRQQHQLQRVRVCLERIKFCLRIILLGSYWKRMMQQQRHKNTSITTSCSNSNSNSNNSPPLALGIMTEGGLFHGFNDDEHDSMGNTIPTIHQQDSRWERKNYVGRRTGRTVVQRTIKGVSSFSQQLTSPKPPDKRKRRRESSSLSSSSSSLFSSSILSPLSPLSSMLSESYRSDRIHYLLIMIGEILYAYRPLFWANTESSSSSSSASYRNWLIAIAMDLISLQCCSSSCQQQQQSSWRTTATRNPSSSSSSSSHHNDAATQTELNRRKMRLFLYLLRSPVWDRWTGPTADRFEDLLDRRVPIVGRLVSTYLRDWLWYTKHPYVSEQG